MDQEVCPKCRKPVLTGAKFCPECGASLVSPKSPVAESSAAPPRKSTAVRDTLIIVGVLAVVTAAYFIFKEQPEAPLPAPPTGNSQSQSVSAEPKSASPQAQPAGDMMGGMTMASLDSLPKDYNKLVQMGNGFMDQHQFAVAAECYKRALAISDESQDVRVDYGACLHGMGLPDRAIEEFRKVLAKSPKHPIATFNMGVVFGDKQMKDSVVAYMKKYLAIDPNGQAAASARQILKENGG